MNYQHDRIATMKWDENPVGHMAQKREETVVLSHYGGDYFNDFQKEIGEFGGRASRFMFEKHILPSDTVLDFGCGGGFLLNNLNCSERIGVELNPVARDFCNYKMGIACYETVEDIPNESIDIVVSSHCLEHTMNPHEIVSILYEKLKKGGRIVVVVPLENYQYKWTPNDVNNHLYSFSPMNLGNILQAVGFKEIKIEPVFHKWAPKHKFIDKVFGFKMFHRLSWLYGNINRNLVQVKGVGIKG